MIIYQIGSLKGPGELVKKRAKLDKILPEYYQLRGWDKKGVWTKEKSKDLRLE